MEWLRAATLVVLVGLLCWRTAPVTNAAGTLHTLTQSDNGTTLTVPVGDSVELRLTSDFNWDVTVSDISVLRRPPVLLVRGVQGLWNAVAPGQAVIQATGTAICAPGTACPQFAVAFSATVVVVPAGGSGGGGGTLAHYPAGWSIVGGPAGATFPVTLYHWDPTRQQYATLSPGTPVQPGQGYWAHFDQQTDVALPAIAGSTDLSAVPSGQWVMVANPSGVNCAGINLGPPRPGTGTPNPNVLAVATYDPSSGYAIGGGAMLLPGEGAWLLLQNSAPPPLLSLGPPGLNGSCIAPP